MTFLFHHPLSAIGTLYLALVSVVIQLDAGVIIVAFVPVFSLALGYFLSKRERRAIRAENTAAATDAVKAAEAAKAAQEVVRENVEKVHVLVNSQKSALEAELVERDSKIAQQDVRIEMLEKMVAGLSAATA